MDNRRAAQSSRLNALATEARLTRPSSPVGVAPLARETSEMSTSDASARRAPTVQVSRGRTLKGSYWKCFMALRWVILLMSSSDTSARYFIAASGAVGQVESE